MRPDANKTQLPPRPDFPWEKMAEVAADDLCDADIHGDEPPGQVTCYACVAIKGTRWALQMRGRLESLEAENESLKARLEKWESRVSSDELSRHLDHGMNCGSKGFDGYDRGSCTCGLIYRIQAQTEQNLRTAWTKRAEEAEAERDQALEVIREYRKDARSEHVYCRKQDLCHLTGNHDDRCSTCIKADALLSQKENS